jgi:hypothetical protein
MTPALRASARHWLAGLALAISGVVVNRLLAPVFAGAQLRAAFALAGELAALTGLVIIMFGVRRRLRLAGQSLASVASSASS